MRKKEKRVYSALVIVLLIGSVLFLSNYLFSVNVSTGYAQGCLWSGTTCIGDDADGYFDTEETFDIIISDEDGYDYLNIYRSDYDPDDDDNDNRKLWWILYKKYGINSPDVGWYDSCSQSGNCRDGMVCESSLTERDKKVLEHFGWTYKEGEIRCKGTQYEKYFEGGYYKNKMDSHDLEILFKDASCTFEGLQGKLVVRDNNIACRVTNTKNYDIDCDDRCNIRFGFSTEEVSFDKDGDGFLDWEDNCPEEGDIGFGLKEDGCPKMAQNCEDLGYYSTAPECGLFEEAEMKKVESHSKTFECYTGECVGGFNYLYLVLAGVVVMFIGTLIWFFRK